MRREWTVVALVFMFMLINYADKAVVGLASVPIMKELNLSHIQFGLLGSAFFLLFSISGVAIGLLTNRVETRTLMAAMSLVWTASMLAVSVVPGFLMLLGSRVVLGAAEGPAFPVAMHGVYKWFTDRERAVPSSLVAIGPAFGSGLLAPLITLVITHEGWRAAFAVLALAGLVWAVLWLLLAREGSVDVVENSAEPPRRVPYRRLLLNRTAVGVYLAGFAAYTLIALSLVWLANYLIDVLHMTPQHAALCIAIPSTLQILLAPSLALGSRHLSRKGVSGRLSRGIPGAACVILAGACLMGLPFVSSGAFQVALLSVGFSIGSVTFTLGSALLGEIAPPGQRGALLGVANSIHASAGLLAPVAMGLIVDVRANAGEGFHTGFFSAGAFVVTLGLIAAVLLDPESDAVQLAGAARLAR